MRATPTRTDDLLIAFHRAGKLGLTTPEMRAAAGSHAVQLLGQLMEAGYGFGSEPAKYTTRSTTRGRPWRYWLVREPAEPAPSQPDEPEPLALFEAPEVAPVPASAVLGGH